MSNEPLGYSLTTSISPYETINRNPLNVVFLPVMNNTETKFITAVTDNTNNEIHVENIAPYNHIDNVEEKEEKPNSIFHIGNNPAAGFYFGSITVVGLYILFRLLHKGK